MLDLLRSALEIAAPDDCAVCGLPGSALCDRCSSLLVPVGGSCCRACGHPWRTPVPTCRACLPGLPAARAAIVYDHRARRLISAFKDTGRVRLAERLAQLIVEAVPRPQVTALVPVPLTRRRRAERGFNQSALIARAVAAIWDLPVAEVLERTRDGRPQRGQGGRARRSGLAGTFVAARAPQSVVLVDDVHTTGATLAACARALRAGGTGRVAAVTLARAPISSIGRI